MREASKGQSKFVINTNGVKMGGELNLKNGKITMPDGEIYGLNIRFPMNYENEALQVASGKPIHISTKNIRYGAYFCRKWGIGFIRALSEYE